MDSLSSGQITTITVREAQPGLLISATLSQLLRCSMEHQIGALRNVGQSGGDEAESPKASRRTFAEGKAANPMMWSMEFTGLGKSTTALIAAVVQTNLQAIQELLRAENPKAMLELQQRFANRRRSDARDDGARRGYRVGSSRLSRFRALMSVWSHRVNRAQHTEPLAR
jgi:hypothetical protein